MRAGFAEVDITPPLGTRNIGWKAYHEGKAVLDPLCARFAALEAGRRRVGFVQMDTLSVRWTQADEIRRRIQQRTGFAGASIMVAATHNHAGPAVANSGDVQRDDAYVETLVSKCADGFAQAVQAMADAEIGFRHVYEFDVSFNRRVVMRDGTVRTNATFADPDALYVEGPIDPEVGVLAARSPGGELLGCIVNFTCHPTHHGGRDVFSAGFPGAVCAGLKAHGCPVTVYLDGASGNISPNSPASSSRLSKAQVAEKLTADVRRALAETAFEPAAELAAGAATLQLPYRELTDEQITGTARGAQRFVDPAIYERAIPRVTERIRRRKTQPAEVQVLRIGDVMYAGIPAEYFVEHGLRIKQQAYPHHAQVVAHANGMVGYVPTQAAFGRGGYETTFCDASRMAPEAGDMMADAAIDLIRRLLVGKGRAR